MHLTRKLLVAVSSVVLLVLGGMAALAWRREVRLFDADMRHDARVLAASLARAAEHAWKLEDEHAAMQLVQNTADRDDAVHIRWVRLDAAPGSPLEATRREAAVDALARHQIVTRRDEHAGKDGALLTYAAVHGPHGEPAALELAESLAAERAYVSTSLLRTAAGAAVLFVLVAGSLSVLGMWLIGRPIAALVDKARRVGAGDLTTPLVLAQRDELGQLAQEMNLMGERLAAEISAHQLATEQLRHADRLTTAGKLASGLAHELGTPLNVVGALAHQIAEREVAGDELVEDARAIEEQAQRMTRLIQELLGFARPRPPERAEVHLDQLARHTALLLAPMATRKGVHLELGRVAAIRTAADTSQLQQVLTNLIVNALQATPAGGTVTLGCDLAEVTPPPDRGGARREWIKLWVRDTGHGMDASTAKRVFEPFFTTKDVGEGTGLGLSVSYGIVREHGGWIDVVSTSGQGSTFSVWLPA
jgi:two-component system NtrC family sensor kinase